MSLTFGGPLALCKSDFEIQPDWSYRIDVVFGQYRITNYDHFATHYRQLTESRNRYILMAPAPHRSSALALASLKA